MKSSEKDYRAYLEHHRISRRGLLRGLFNSVQKSGQSLKPKRTLLRPPGAVDEHLFIQQCNQCGECVKACPLGMIHIEDDYPLLDFSGTYCDECSLCIEACRHGALISSTCFDTGARPVLSHYCKNHHIDCYICLENCPHEAISWQKSQSPSIDSQSCTGCGRCYFACDSKSWQMQVK